jgi:hypothetical protein
VPADDCGAWNAVVHFGVGHPPWMKASGYWPIWPGGLSP